MLSANKIKDRLRKFDREHHVPNFDHDETSQGFPKAGVLVPLFMKNDEPYVLLTVRSKNLKSFSGHVAFPGGKSDNTDRNVIETALRESYEEIGLPPEKVEILSSLGECIVRPNTLVFPVAGFIPDDFEPIPVESEVSRVFSLPLARFLSRERRSITNTNITGFQWKFYSFLDFVDGGDPVNTFGFTASVCILVAMIVYDRDADFEPPEDEISITSVSEQFLRFLESVHQSHL